MGRKPTKAVSNVYCQARLNAAIYDDRFNSREKAAEMLGISPYRLTEYELELGGRIPAESVCLMAELYNAPELRSFYCHHQCPIGAIDINPVYSHTLEGITLNILAEMNKLLQYKDRLIEIAADGQITEEEEEDFDKILENLDGIVTRAQELKIFAEKSRRR